MRYYTLMLNTDTGTSSEFSTRNQRLARSVAARAKRREDVVAGVVGRIDGRTGR
jgi:hypothetical protein